MVEYKEDQVFVQVVQMLSLMFGKIIFLVLNRVDQMMMVMLENIMFVLLMEQQ